jgi:hypothetical protein
MASKKAEKRRERKMGSARKKAESHEAGFARTAIKVPPTVSLFALPKKSARIDLIPYELSSDNAELEMEKGDLWYEKTYFVHRSIGANEDAFCCLRKNFNKKCPICEHRARLARDPKADKDLLKGLEPKERQLFNVFDHNEPEMGVQLLDVSYHLFGKMVDAKVENGDKNKKGVGEYDTFFDPDNGYTIKVGTKEKSFNGRSFMEASDIEFKKREEPLDEELLNAATALDTLLLEKSYEDLKKIFLQTSDEDDEDDEDDDDDQDDDDEDEDDDEGEDGASSKSTSRKRSDSSKSSSKKSSKREEEEDDEDDEDDDDEPPKSSKKGGKTSSKSSTKDSDDDEDDDEDDEDEEDEVKGKPTAKSKGIKVGTTVVHDDYGDCEVVHVSPDGTSLRIKDEDDDVHKAIGVDEVEVKVKKKKKDDDEDEPPKSSKKKKRRDDFEDDEDDDEDDDE